MLILAQPQLKEIWNLASVNKGKSLCKQEFEIFLAYIMLLQRTPSAILSLQTLKQHFTTLADLPKFNGIELP